MVPEAKVTKPRPAWWRRLLSWLTFWRTPDWYKYHRRKEAEKRVNPVDTYLLVYETPNGPAFLGRHKGTADDAMDACQEAYVNLLWNKGEFDSGEGDYHEAGIVTGNYGIIPENSLSEEAKQRINATTKGE